jgi:hypothetical protein
MVRCCPLLFLALLAGLAGGCGPGSRGPDQVAVLGQPWGTSAVLLGPKIPYREQDHALGPGQSPAVLIGRQVYDVVQGRELGRVEGPWNDSDVRARAISTDGQYCVLVVARQSAVEFRLIAGDSGQTIRNLTPPDESQTWGTGSILAFTDARHLLGITADVQHSATWLWDIETGQIDRRFSLPSLGEASLAISGDGTRLAIVAKGVLSIFDPPTGLLERSAALPAELQGGDCAGLAFSAKDDEVAGFFRDRQRGDWVVVWNLEGKVAFQHHFPVPLPVPASAGRQIAWTLDAQGWILARRFLLDRLSKQILWTLESAAAGGPAQHFLDQDHLLVVSAAEPDAKHPDSRRLFLSAIKVPWPAIREAGLTLAAGAADAAYLRPDQAVSLNLQAAAVVSGDPADVLQSVATMVADCLRASGHPLADEQPVTMRARYWETRGKRRSLLDSRGIDREMTEIRGALDLDLLAKGCRKPLWSARIRRSSPGAFDDKTTDQSLHNAMLRSIAGTLRETLLPSYVSKDRRRPVLPLVTFLGPESLP